MTTSTVASEELLERDAELRRLRRVLDAATRDEGSVTVLAAPAGLGKTALLEAALADATAAGLRTLVARASELEADYAFGVARQLVEPAIAGAAEQQRARLLGGAARHAAAVLDLDPDAAQDRDVHATLHGLHWLLLNLAADGPMLVAVDDVQWADEPSLRWLAYLARRLEGAPIALVATLRVEGSAGGRVAPADGLGAAAGTGRDGSSPGTARDGSGQGAAGDVSDAAARHAAIHDLLGAARVQRIEPPALSPTAVAALLERTLERRPEPTFAAACHAHTDGNPFLVSEVVAELAAEGVAPTAPASTRSRGPCPTASARRCAATSRGCPPTPVRWPRRSPWSARAASCPSPPTSRS